MPLFMVVVSMTTSGESQERDVVSLTVSHCAWTLAAEYLQDPKIRLCC